MIDGYRARGESVHLRFGIEYHRALQDYDIRVANGDTHTDALHFAIHQTLIKTWERVKCVTCNGTGFAEYRGCIDCQGTGDEEGGAKNHPWVPDHPAKNRETLIRSIIWYLDQFGEADPAKTITLANGTPAVELSFKMPTEIEIGITDGAFQKPDGNQMTYMLSGHLDRLVTFGEATYVMDRKTTGTTLSPSYFSQFEPDNQMTLYTIAGQLIYQTPVAGVIIDAAQIAVGFTRFERAMTHRSPGQIEEWLKDLKSWFRLAERYAEEDYWPQNDKNCFLCTFRGICSKDPSVREIFLQSEFEINPWNPLEPR